MKAMNEFESVLAIAALILTVCAAVDLPFGASTGASSRPPNAAPDYAAAPSVDLVKRDSVDIVGTSAAGEPSSASSPAAADRQAPALLMQSLR